MKEVGGAESHDSADVVFDQLAQKYGIDRMAVKALYTIVSTSPIPGYAAIPGNESRQRFYWADLVLSTAGAVYKDAQVYEERLRQESTNSPSESSFFSPEYQLVRLLIKMAERDSRLEHLRNDPGVRNLLDEADKRFRK